MFLQHCTDMQFLTSFSYRSLFNHIEDEASCGELNLQQILHILTLWVRAAPFPWALEDLNDLRARYSLLSYTNNSPFSTHTHTHNQFNPYDLRAPTSLSPPSLWDWLAEHSLRWIMPRFPVGKPIFPPRALCVSIWFSFPAGVTSRVSHSARPSEWENSLRRQLRAAVNRMHTKSFRLIGLS